MHYRAYLDLAKSTLINETVYKVLANHLNRASHQAQPYKKL